MTYDNRNNNSDNSVAEAVPLMHEHFEKFVENFCIQAYQDEHGFWGDDRNIYSSIVHIRAVFVLRRNDAVLDNVKELEKTVYLLHKHENKYGRTLRAIRGEFYKSIGKPEYIAIGDALDIVKAFENVRV